MADKNFMTVGTEIDGLIEKKKQIITKIANELAEACVSRANSGKMNQSISRDIYNIIDKLPIEDQRDVLLQLSTILSQQLEGKKVNRGNNDNNKRGYSSNDIFANRRF